MNPTNLTQMFDLELRPTRYNLARIWTLDAQPDPKLGSNWELNLDLFWGQPNLTCSLTLTYLTLPDPADLAQNLGRFWPHYKFTVGGITHICFKQWFQIAHDGLISLNHTEFEKRTLRWNKGQFIII